MLFSGCSDVSTATKKGIAMLKTNASIRRFIAYQKQANPDSEYLLHAWREYEIYVYCVADTETPKTFKEWITS